MSDVRRGYTRWLICLVIVAMVAIARLASGQTTAEYSHRVDSLAEIWRAASAQQIHVDSARIYRLPTDTIRVGNLFILADSAHAALARGAAERLSPSLDLAYGTAAARLRAHTLVLKVRMQFNARDTTPVIESGIADEHGELHLLSADLPDEKALVNSWRGKMELLMSNDLGADFHDWVMGPIASEPPDSRALADARVELVLSSSRGAHECAAGNLARCRQVLGLATVDDPAFTLFDEDERRQMLDDRAAILRRANEQQFDRCTVAHSQAACDSLVHAIPIAALPAPVSPKVKQYFVRYALLVGGPGAFGRLAVTSGTPQQRIEAAAGIPTDSLIRRWQATVMSSSASSTAIDGETATSAIFWAALCGALALRSSRWR